MLLLDRVWFLPQSALLLITWLFFFVSPEKSSSLPTSSQDLADIFGTGSEGPNMEFPFNLSMETDLALAGPRGGDYFLNSLNTLGIPASVTASSSSSSMVTEASRREISASDVGRRQGQAYKVQGSSGAAARVSGSVDAGGHKEGERMKEANEVDKKESSSSEGLWSDNELICFHCRLMWNENIYF